ncbi:MAG: TolC family protein [Campylobacterota bacterium]|nr:TolC family protein [Campylobacterota bacterium]
MKKKILLLSLPFYLYATSIDFDLSLEKTLNNNKSLKAKEQDIKKSQLDLKEASGYDYGSLIFNENISVTNNAGYVFGAKLASREATFGDFGFAEFDMTGATNPLPVAPEALNNPDKRKNYETKLTYKLPIFTGYKLKNAKKMAKLQILAQKAKYNYDQKALGLEVLKAYNGAVASKEFIKATLKAKEATNSFKEFANELYKEGLVTNIDVKQATVYDMGVDTKIIEAKNRFDLSISYLRFLTSDDTITDVKEFKNIDIDSKVLSSLQNQAKDNREDFKWMRYNTDTMRAKIDFESADLYPMVGAQIEYGYNDNSFTIVDINEHDYYMGAIGISYTLFDGSISKIKEQKAKIEYKKTLNYFEYMEDGIKLEVEKNLLTLNAKEKILNQKIKAQNLADEVLEQSSQMYKNHLINMSNLLMQQASSQKASAETIMAKYEKSLQAATLKISLGETLQSKDK